MDHEKWIEGMKCNQLVLVICKSGMFLVVQGRVGAGSLELAL